MNREEEPAESPNEYLKQVGKKLALKLGVDAGLAAVLAQHILVGNVEDDAVVQAKAAIVALAKARAHTAVEVVGE
jgi:hypothetical protein